MEGLTTVQHPPKEKFPQDTCIFSSFKFFLSFIVYVLQIRSPADFKGAAVMFFFYPAELKG